MRLVMIGCGGMGNYQAKKFTELGVQIVGAIDHNEEHRRGFCTAYGLSHSFALLEDLPFFQGKADAISCCLPDSLHTVCCKQALGLGFAVFCEKPLATSVEEADSLSVLAKDLPFMVNFSKRSTPALAALKQVLEERTLGELRQVQIAYLQSWQKSHVWGNPEENFRWKWRLLPSYNPGGCLSDLGSHLLDILFLLFGTVSFEKTEEKICDGVPLSYQATLAVGDAIPCTFACSYCDETWDDSLQLTVVGSLASAALNTSLDRKHILLTTAGQDRFPVSSPPLASAYQNFVRWVDDGVPGKPDLEDGLRVQALLEEMNRWV